MSRTVDLSIVIVNWNTRDILRDCLASVRAGIGALAAEVLVVDNASRDGSAEMVQREFPEVRLMRMAHNLGFAGGNNVALREACGRNVLLLNSDTIVLGDVLTRCVEWLDSHEQVGVMGCRALNADMTMQRTCFQDPTHLNLLLDALFLSRMRWPKFLGRYQMKHWKRDSERAVDVVTGCFMLVKRAAMTGVGLMDDTFFFYAEESDWCLRFRRAGWKVMFAPVGSFIHLGGASAQQLSVQRDVLLHGGLLHWHVKHGTATSAKAAERILRGGLRLRQWIWTMRCWLTRSERARVKRNHAGEVLLRWAEVRKMADATEPPSSAT